MISIAINTGVLHLRPAAGTWARCRDSRRDRARRPAGLREQAQPSAARGRERAAGTAGVRQRRVHDGRWLAGGATAGGCGGGLRGGVTAGGCLGTQTAACWATGRRAGDQQSKAQGRQAGSCLLGRWAASWRATEQGTRKAGSNSKDQGALSNPRFGFCTTEHLCRSKLQFILLNYLACFFTFA